MASNSAPTSRDNTSYTAMAVGDVEAIGAHCQMEYCRQLDFLPFRCESCHSTFCLDHRSETAHKCPNAGAWARARTARNAGDVTNYRPTSKPTIQTHEKQCANPTCKTLIDTALAPGVHCPTCNYRYCLKHRMREDHDCANVKPKGAVASPFAAQKSKLREMLGAMSARNKASNQNSLLSKFKPAAAKSRSSQLASLNALKSAAKGDSKIPVEQRVYLHVEASADTTKAKFPTGKFYYAKDWSVGRMLDAAAKALQVENVNNRGGGEDERLRVFHVEGGRLLGFSEKVGDVVQNGNTIVLLRGVGEPIPDLVGG